MTSSVVGQTPAQIAALSLTSIAKFTTIDIAALTAPQVAAMSSAQVNALSAANIKGFSNSQIAAFTASTIGGLTSSSISALTPAQIAALSTTQVAAISTTDMAALTPTQVAAFTANNIAALSGAQLNALGATLIKTLSNAQVSAISTTAIAALSSTSIGALSASQAAQLTSAQVSALSTSQVAGLSTTQIGALTKTDVSGLSANDIKALSAAQVGALSASSLSGLTPNALGALSAAQVGALSAVQLNGLSASQIGTLTSAQTSALTATQLNGLTTVNIGALVLPALSASQIGALNPSVIAAMSGKTFAAAIGGNLAALSTTEVKALTSAQLSSLTSAQIAGLTTGQISAMSSAQTAVVSQVSGSPVAVDVAHLASGGALSYSSLLSILNDAASGGMTAAKLTSLQALAKSLNAPGGITTTAYAQQIFNDVVLGNSANATWTGGAKLSTTLGNLSATSSATQMQELIGKWFLGTDMPSPATAPGGSGIPTTYQAVSLPLFTAAGPSINDADQGNIGDCYFMAALDETALLDPSVIKNMIKDNGNGSYSVEFQINGKADYVTVNNQLATFAGTATNGFVQPNGSKLEFANSTNSSWAPLIEKAYVELVSQAGVQAGADYNTNGNAYADISGGWGQALGEITGKTVTTYNQPKETTSYISSLLSTFQSDLASGQEVLLGTSNTKSTNANLVAGHVFEVTAVNAATGMVSLQNPWGSATSASNLQENFTVSAATLAADGAVFYATSGKSAYAA